MEQKTAVGFNTIKQLDRMLAELPARKFMLVCDSAFKFLKIDKKDIGLQEDTVIFDDFTPNPVYEDVCKGVKLFCENACDGLVVIGGGSAIDVAKCIKLFSALPPEKNYLEQAWEDSKVPLVAIPTTAGTGSESTHFAVIYYEGKKISVAHKSLLPDNIVLDASLLQTLPLYQKKCTMLDALCHGIESWWSVNSSAESIEYSRDAVTKIIRYKDEYLSGNSFAAEQILLAANLAGKAINITKTTAAHAMSYKLTSMYKIPHGHAVAICLPYLWKYMFLHEEKCADVRGEKYLSAVFNDIAHALGKSSVKEGIEYLETLLKELQLEVPQSNRKDVDVLVSSVNTERLQNNPVTLTDYDLSELYCEILKQ